MLTCRSFDEAIRGGHLPDQDLVWSRPGCIALAVVQHSVCSLEFNDGSGELGGGSFDRPLHAAADFVSSTAHATRTYQRTPEHPRRAQNRRYVWTAQRAGASIRCRTQAFGYLPDRAR
jgi:hypothetical protein